MATHCSILAWKIPRQRSLVGCSPWCHTESDTPERVKSNNMPHSMAKKMPYATGRRGSHGVDNREKRQWMAEGRGRVGQGVYAAEMQGAGVHR